MERSFNPYVPPTENLDWLQPPFEIVDFVPGKPYYFYISSWKLGKLEITPQYPGAPERKIIAAIRLYAQPGAKKAFPYYWDITPSRLVYQLATMLMQGIKEKMMIKVVRDIPGPKAHFEVQWVPLDWDLIKKSPAYTLLP